MLCIISPYTNPYFNLAAEEYLLKSFQEDLFLLYRNRPSIVVGKHQNTLAEINLPFVQENEILVARRITGGGTVFHDLGNLNFAFFTSGKEGELVDYKRATTPIVEALKKMGLEVRLGKHNELLLKGLKISGTASHVFKQRVLHHGTLLFSSEMGKLSAALKSDKERFTDRAVKSVRSRVTNISDHLKESVDVEIFQERILAHMLQNYKDARPYQLGRTDIAEIKALRDSKYSTWEWNFGYSPKYQFCGSISFKGGSLELHMNVVKGVIKELKIVGDFTSLRDIVLLEQELVGIIHDPETIRNKLSGVDVSNYIRGLENEELLMGMF
ncbi:MAG: lipoate--protein ligase family protein [Bacteroidetes bacterium]|nr:MAG: lipoate--protein ligase family protein [Bacteroidota bacterium]